MPPGQILTWGATFHRTPTSADIVIETVEAMDPRGVTIIGMSMIRPDVAGGIVTASSTRLLVSQTMPVEGAVLTPTGGTSPFLEVLTGVALSAGSTQGSIAGLRVRNESGAREYEYVVTQSLMLTPTSP